MTDWWVDALCAEVGGDMWVPDSENFRLQVAAAKTVCAVCPVKDACLEDALVTRAEGVRGGTTMRERAAIRAARRRDAA